MQENFRVLQEADPATVPPTFEAWLKSRFGFIGYCRMKLNEVAGDLNPVYVASLTHALDALVCNLQTRSDHFRKSFYNVRDRRLATL